MRYAEQQDHIAVVQHLRRRAVAGLVYWHCPQGAHYSNPRQGALMKALGTRPGASDLMMLYQGRFYALELKRLKGGRTQAEQRQFIDDVRKAGGTASIAKGLDEALKILESWNLLRGHTEVAWDLFDRHPPTLIGEPNPALVSTETLDLPDVDSAQAGLPKRRRKRTVTLPS